jgi:hypothetical protein
MRQEGGTVDEACCGIIRRNTEHLYFHLYFERSSVLTSVHFISPVTASRDVWASSTWIWQLCHVKCNIVHALNSITVFYSSPSHSQLPQTSSDRSFTPIIQPVDA